MKDRDIYYLYMHTECKTIIILQCGICRMDKAGQKMLLEDPYDLKQDEIIYTYCKNEESITE